MADPSQVQRLAHISAGIDERICTAIELGITERLYFHRVVMPAVENEEGELVSPPHPEWQPVTGPVQAELLVIVQGDLRSVPVNRQPSESAAQHRRDFEAAINHRPGDSWPSIST